jgi:hypothetical protein
MATTLTTQTLTLDDKRRNVRTVFGGSVAESVAAGATIVLTLIALSGIMVETILPVAVILMGVAFLLEGGAISTRFSKLLIEAGNDRLDRAELGVGVTSEFVGGATGVIFGILSLTRLSLMTLLPVAVLVYGITLILSSGIAVRLNTLEIEGSSASARFKEIAHVATTAAVGIEFVLGLSAVILGIIALSLPYNYTLTLVAMLLIGISGVISGSAVSARMSSLLHSQI